MLNAINGYSFFLSFLIIMKILRFLICYCYYVLHVYPQASTSRLLLMSQNNALLVFCYTVRTMLPLFPFGYLDLGIVGRSEAKVGIDDDFVHLRHREEGQMQPQLQLYIKMVSITHEYLI